MALIDQLPEALLPLIMLQAALQLAPRSIVGTALAFSLLDLIATRVASRLPADR